MSTVGSTACPFFESTIDLDKDAKGVIDLPFYARSITIKASQDADPGANHKFGLNVADFTKEDMSFNLDTSPSENDNTKVINLSYHCESRFLVKRVHIMSGKDATSFRVTAIA